MEDVRKQEHDVAIALLSKRGITQPTYDQYADAAAIAAKAVERGRTSTAETLALAALNGAEVGSDDKLATILSRFSLDGKFVGDLSLTEQELLEAAVASREQERVEGVVAAEAVDDDLASAEYCPVCEFHLADYGCQC
jgi:hypothetical protein